MPFSQPSAPGTGINLQDHNGALLLIDVESLEVGVKTVHGDSDAISCDIAVLEGTGAGQTYEQTLIFPKVLVGQLKRSIGEKVLGRLGQGVAKPGQSAPWILNEASAEDIAKAEEWVANNTKPKVTSAQAPF